MTRWLLACCLASFGAAAVAEPCRPIDGLQPLLRAGRVLLLGEIHGTMESPAFALEVACHAMELDLAVIVGLELATAEQARVDIFLDSAGTEQDRVALLAGPPWQSSYQDGRASRAMLDLIDGLRQLRRQGRQVGVALFDAPVSGGGQRRDGEMARQLATVIGGSPASLMIVLTGNVHSRIIAGMPRSPSYEPMGYLLGRATSFDNLVALNVAHAGGSAWICAPACGVQELSGRHGDSAWRIEIAEATRPAGHSGWYHVGRVTASLPARLARTESEALEALARDATGHVSRDAIRAEPESVDFDQGGDQGLSATEAKLQGEWQAYDFNQRFKTWAFRFEGRSFRAQAGTDDWYVGHIVVHQGDGVGQIDFAIEDCRCSFKGMTSEAIYRWEGQSLVISAPQPGDPRPLWFEDSSPQMMLLLPLGGQ